MQISFHLHLHNVLRIPGQDVGIMINFDINVYIYIRISIFEASTYEPTARMEFYRHYEQLFAKDYWPTVDYWPLSLGQPTKFHWLDGNVKHINNPPDFAVLPPQGI